MEPFRIQGGQPKNLFTQAVSVIAGLLVVGVAFFLGLFFLAIFLALFVIAGIAIAARVWWLRRKVGGQAGHRASRRHDGSVLEGEYVVVDQSTKERVKESEDR